MNENIHLTMHNKDGTEAAIMFNCIQLAGDCSSYNVGLVHYDDLVFSKYGKDGVLFALYRHFVSENPRVVKIIGSYTSKSSTANFYRSLDAKTIKVSNWTNDAPFYFGVVEMNHEDDDFIPPSGLVRITLGPKKQPILWNA